LVSKTKDEVLSYRFYFSLIESGNAVLLCQSCNSSKHTSTMWELLEETKLISKYLTAERIIDLEFMLLEQEYYLLGGNEGSLILF